MTPEELERLEAELKRRGYRKFTHSLTCSESWAWFKTFDRVEDGDAVKGYQVAFRVWDSTRYGQTGSDSYGFDFWTSPIDPYSRMDFTANWAPFRDFDTFEAMAKAFYDLTRQFTDKKQAYGPI